MCSRLLPVLCAHLSLRDQKWYHVFVSIICFPLLPDGNGEQEFFKLKFFHLISQSRFPTFWQKGWSLSVNLSWLTLILKLSGLLRSLI